MFQQGQVFKLRAKGGRSAAVGLPLPDEGRGSSRPQVGGFATRAEAQKALAKVIERLGPGGRASTMTLAELVDEYLEMHQAEPATIQVVCSFTAGEAMPCCTTGPKRTFPEGQRSATRRSVSGRR